MAPRPEGDNRDALEQVEQPGEWLDLAACRGFDPGLWYPSAGESGQDAKRVCRQCSVQEPCLEYALAVRERYGVWGGASEIERRLILRARHGARPEMARPGRPRKDLQGDDVLEDPGVMEDPTERAS